MQPATKTFFTAIYARMPKAQLAELVRQETARRDGYPAGWTPNDEDHLAALLAALAQKEPNQ